MNRPVPTLNNFGYQMGAVSPLLHDWLKSYDGKHPLLDIGCAYGINTFKALEKGIPIVALDPEVRHLEILRENLDRETLHLITCVKGSLPHCIGYPDNFFSGILCAEVLHFMDGKCIEESIKTMHTKLAPRGKLVMTMISYNYLKYIYPEKETEFHRDLEEGEKWPGYIKFDEEFINRFESVIQSERMRSTMKFAFPGFIHFLSDQQMTEELKQCGFVVNYVNLGDHPGHPDNEGIGRLPGQSLQIVAEKM